MAERPREDSAFKARTRATGDTMHQRKEWPRERRFRLRFTFLIGPFSPGFQHGGTIWLILLRRRFLQRKILRELT